MEKFLISIVVPTRNRVCFLKTALNSAIFQTYRNTEIIIVNDASQDETYEFCKKLAKNQPNIKVINNAKQIGGSASRNLGIFASRGAYVAFLDDDDQWVKNKLELQINEIGKDNNNLAVSCWFYSVNKNNVSLKKIESPKKISDLLLKNSLGGASMLLVKKATLLKCGLFDPNLQSCQYRDWETLFL